jgi:hypothetical protein
LFFAVSIVTVLDQRRIRALAPERLRAQSIIGVSPVLSAHWAIAFIPATLPTGARTCSSPCNPGQAGRLSISIHLIFQGDPNPFQLSGRLRRLSRSGSCR